MADATIPGGSGGDRSPSSDDGAGPTPATEPGARTGASDTAPLGIDDEAEEVDDRPRLVRFTVTGRGFLVGVESVQEVLVAGPCTRLPGSAPAIVGVTSVRGRIVAVVDPRPVLHAAADRTDPDRLLVVRTADGPVGLLVDRVDDVVPAEPEHHPPSIDDTDPVVVATAVVDGVRLPVVDPVALVARAIASGHRAGEAPDRTTVGASGSPTGSIAR